MAKQDTYINKTVQFTKAGNPDMIGKVIEENNGMLTIMVGKIKHVIPMQSVTLIK